MCFLKFSCVFYRLSYVFYRFLYVFYRKPMKPIENLWKPIENLWKPIENIWKPIENLWKPIEHLWKPIENMRKPMENLWNPIDSLEQLKCSGVLACPPLDRLVRAVATLWSRASELACELWTWGSSWVNSFFSATLVRSKLIAHGWEEVPFA